MVQGKGCWVSYVEGTQGGIEGGEIGFHSSELGALRRAVSINGRAVHVEFGQTLGEAIEGKAADDRLPGEEPLPLDDVPVIEDGAKYLKGGVLPTAKAVKIDKDETVISEKGK